MAHYACNWREHQLILEVKRWMIAKLTQASLLSVWEYFLWQRPRRHFFQPKRSTSGLQAQFCHWNPFLRRKCTVLPKAETFILSNTCLTPLAPLNFWIQNNWGYFCKCASLPWIIQHRCFVKPQHLWPNRVEFLNLTLPGDDITNARSWTLRSSCFSWHERKRRRKKSVCFSAAREGFVDDRFVKQDFCAG